MFAPPKAISHPLALPLAWRRGEGKALMVAIVVVKFDRKLWDVVDDGAE